MPGDRTSIPPDPKTMAYLLSEFRKDQKATGQTLQKMSGTLESINTEITNIKEANAKQDERMSKIEDRQNRLIEEPPIRSLNARVKQLEKNDRQDLKDRADASGAMDMTNERDRDRAEAMAAEARQNASTDSWKVLLTPKVLLTILLVAVVCIALGAVVIAKAFGYVDVPTPPAVEAVIEE